MREDVIQAAGRLSALFLTLALFCSCRSPGLLPPVDTSQPGWSAQQGQAVWKPPGKRPELAGDLLMATNTAGDCLIQFTKIPFPIATAQISDGAWQIEFGARKWSWGGHGSPPKRFVWFQLPAAFRSGEVAGHWTFERLGAERWRFTNKRSGEFLEGEFFP